ncbi:MAG: orotidine-5'-phosphate decarboxylase [Deltaproteobacteria bacterium]|nr:orotidine-5'-phosphate decarboxylase [Deltaproteobacteria bacterium]
MSVFSLLGAPPGQMQSRLIFALDVDTTREALELVDALRGEVGLFKVGKQLFLHAGPEIIRQIKQRGADIFLDLKFHDIPRTVAKAGAEATRLGVRMFDLHASGSTAMMKQTISEVNKVSRTEHLVRPKLLAVTVLTSLSQDDLKLLGVRSGVESHVVRLARMARDAGMDGVVAAPQEVARIRKECGRRFLIVTPGIREPRNTADDQKRIMTPEAAIRAGANYLVVGSPIRDASDPVAAARAIVASMERGAGLAAALRG